MKTSSLLLTLFAGFQCAAQSPAPVFDAASVKLATDESAPVGGRRIQTSPGSLVTHGLPLRAAIMWAYDMPAQVAGPDWLNDVRLDITAKAGTRAGDKELYRMLRTLLEERMGVKTHVEKREMPVYALTLAKGGPKFKESATEGPLTVTQGKGGVFIQHGAMSELATELSGKVFDRPVIDATGLKGRYDIPINMTSLMSVNSKDGMDAVTAMMTLLQDQMGLKVESRKGRVDVLVVDHAEKTPTAN